MAARPDFSSATRAIVSRAPPATPRSTVCSSSPRVAAFFSPARPSRTIWKSARLVFLILQELFALSEFVNPGVFSSLASFRQLFVRPIEAGRRKGCSEADRELAAMRSAEVRSDSTLIPSSLALPISLFCVEPLRRFSAPRFLPKSLTICSLHLRPSSDNSTKNSSNCSEDRLLSTEAMPASSRSRSSTLCAFSACIHRSLESRFNPPRRCRRFSPF